MKLLFIFYSLFTLAFKGDNDFYTRSFESIDGKTINMADYKGKRVVIIVINAANPNLNQLRYFDSIVNSNASVKVIAVPTEDFGAASNLPLIKNLQKSLTLVISKPLKVKKNSSQPQHSLFNWLTNTSQNTHFDYDVTSEGQVFIISEKGTLFGVLSKEVSLDVANSIINQPFNE
jgi:glutathione peroxidase